jgi:hypothetical protein
VKSQLRSGLAVVCVVLAAGSAETVRAQEPGRGTLVAGVAEIAAPGLPGTVGAFGPEAFPVVVGSVNRRITGVVVAAGKAGPGRAVVFGHTDYLDGALSVADTGRLVLNSARWTAGSHVLRVGVHGLTHLREFLQKNGVEVEALEGADWTARAKGYAVVACPMEALSEREVTALTAYLKGGGGLMASDTGWGWLQTHPGRSLTQHPGNRVLAAAGIGWTDGTLDRSSKKGFDAAVDPSELTQASAALDLIVAQSEGKAPRPTAEVAQAVWTISGAALAMPDEDRLLRPRLRALQQKHQGELATLASRPIKATDPLARLLFTLKLQESRNLPAEKVTASPAAAAFPGSVPADAPRVTREVRVNAAIPEWHSTGVYAAPGDHLTIEVPEELAGKGLQVRIGAHSDSLWSLPEWDRAPEITRVFPLRTSRTVVANAFGGPVYIVVPGRSRLGLIPVKIEGGVEAPLFVRGVTDPAAWKEKIRNAPAPWAELQGDNVILTVPSRVVRTLEDPEALLALWDRAMDDVADLAGIPRKRLRPERYVTDRQISAGYMHSGYPIMMGLDVAEAAVSTTSMRANGHAGVWGFFHEVGHNHQVSDWTFNGTGEVTNNMFAIYVFEKEFGITQSQHPALVPAKMQERLHRYIAGGADFEKWKSDPFLALTMYIELQQAFGWDAYKKLFAEYRALPASERPKTELEQHDQWMVRFSHAVGKNLGPFFQAWGVPTSESARRSLTDLPAWMPADFPTKS